MSQSQALDDVERGRLLDIVKRLGSSPTTVDGTQLATARNLAARAGLDKTKLALDREIQHRGEGAQEPDAIAGNTARESRPLWPIALGLIVLVSGLAYSHPTRAAR